MRPICADPLFFCAKFWSSLFSPGEKIRRKIGAFFRKFVRWRALACVGVRWRAFFARILKNARNFRNAQILGAQNSGFFARIFAPIVHYSNGSGFSFRNFPTLL